MPRAARRRIPAGSAAALALATAACSSVPPQGNTRIERDLPEQARALQGGALARATVHADDHASLVLARVSGPIAPHRHLFSEEIVYLLSGAGTLQREEGPLELRAGDLVVVPRNTPHGFVPAAGEAAVVLSIFVPPLREGDRVAEPVDQRRTPQTTE